MTEEEALTILWKNKGAGLSGAQEKFVYATTAKRIVVTEDHEHRTLKGKQWTQQVERELPLGTTVLVTMYSRFGDVGIRDTRLEPPSHGYIVRVLPDHLKDWRERP